MNSKIKWSLVIIGIIFVLTFFSFTGAISAFKWFVETTGYVGLFLVVFFLDTIFIQPISPTIFTVIVLLGGLDYFMVFLVASTASFLAGIMGYFLGNKFGITFLEKYSNNEKLHKAQKLFNKYSTWAIVLGSTTVVPFSLICWMSGISKVRFSKFLIVSFLTRYLGFLAVVLMTYYGIDFFSKLI